MSSGPTRRVKITPRSSSASSICTASGSSTSSRTRYSRRSRISGRLGGLGFLLPRLLRPLRREPVPDADLGHQHPYGVGRLRPDAKPVQRPVLLDLDQRRVVHCLAARAVRDEPAVSRASLVCDVAALEGSLLGPYPFHPDPIRHPLVFQPLAGRFGLPGIRGMRLPPRIVFIILRACSN